MVRCDAIILAAGSGKRLETKLGVAKQFAELAGKPVWLHAVESLAAHSNIGHILLVLPTGSNRPANCPEAVHCIEGGVLRQDSVHSGLTYLASLPDAADYVAIHDSARPFVPKAVIDRLLAALDAGAKAVIPTLPVADTIKEISPDSANKVQRTIPRETLIAVQTPQAFERRCITELHQQLQNAPKPVTDDASLVELAGIPVVIVDGDSKLHKLTVPEDFEMAVDQTAIMETRIGTGYDVHKFIDGRGKIAVCGIEVEHEKSIEAHSDGDVGLHALCDAIFGALGDGDIGQHFPPSDEKWKDAASDQFLRFAVGQVLGRGGKIINLDVTIICERPKIGPLRDKMRAKLAEIADIALSRVSVKATTSEKLGFTGRGEGIAAMASVSLSLPASTD